MHYTIHIFFIEPVIKEPGPTEKYITIINGGSNKNDMTEIDLPVVGTENGPFGLVND